MSSPLLVVTGTGTGIGKTHLCVALVVAARARGLEVCAVKPVETGAGPHGAAADRARLEAASGFHVKRAALRQTYAAPLSPHLAARRERRPVDVPGVVRAVRELRAGGRPVLVELPGGLFSPLRGAPRVLDNADLAARLGGQVLLVVPDRLGALHDARAAQTAAQARGVSIAATALIQQRNRDSSSILNANALRDLGGPPVVGTIPRGTPPELARTDAVRAILDAWLGPPTPTPRPLAPIQRQPSARRPRSRR